MDLLMLLDLLIVTIGLILYDIRFSKVLKIIPQRILKILSIHFEMTITIFSIYLNY